MDMLNQMIVLSLLYMGEILFIWLTSRPTMSNSNMIAILENGI